MLVNCLFAICKFFSVYNILLVTYLDLAVLMVSLKKEKEDLEDQFKDLWFQWLISLDNQLFCKLFLKEGI